MGPRHNEDKTGRMVKYEIVIYTLVYTESMENTYKHIFGKEDPTSPAGRALAGGRPDQPLVGLHGFSRSTRERLLRLAEAGRVSLRQVLETKIPIAATALSALAGPDQPPPKASVQFGRAVVQLVHSVRRVKCIISNTKLPPPVRPLFLARPYSACSGAMRVEREKPWRLSQTNAGQQA